MRRGIGMREPEIVVTYRRRLTATPLLCGVGVLLSACGARPPPAPREAPPVVDPCRVGVYSEFVSLGEARAALPALARHGLALYRRVMPSDVGSDELTALMREASMLGVCVRPWLVADTVDGYWLNEDNLDVFEREVDRLLAWRRSAGLDFDWLTLDLEPGWDYTHALLEAGAKPGAERFTAMLQLLASHVRPAEFERHRERLSALVEKVQASGLKVHAVTYPLVLDDATDGDDRLQDALDIPVRGVPWDEVSFMVYRSALALYSPGPFGPDLVGTYAAEARRQYGATAGLDMGVIGRDPVGGAEGYLTPDVLETDVGAVKAAGVDRLHLYALESALERTDAERWLSFGESAALAGVPA
ncbi:MAG: hypothetical protein RL199_2423, partial [Pseudomonadota bacterium]